MKESCEEERPREREIDKKDPCDRREIEKQISEIRNRIFITDFVWTTIQINITQMIFVWVTRNGKRKVVFLLILNPIYNDNLLSHNK